MFLKIKNINLFVIVFLSHSLMVELRIVPIHSNKAAAQCVDVNDTKFHIGCYLDENNFNNSTLDFLLNYFYNSKFNQVLSKYLYHHENDFHAENVLKKLPPRSVNNKDFVNDMPSMFKRDFSGEFSQDFKQMSKNLLDMNKELAMMTKNLTIMSDDLAGINVD
ncbi:uncharacterized protein LOC119606426 [Lucilia sericata]|uniref:uncharacterized protein LOC119606426 n=1 Tax=Lucilia sericata TaxID=13632 RepID=UPI0018A808D5|nr:uncharacterized protein LOC119606426 [Lucilia sericata]